MSNRKTTEENRILSEMMEMAQALQGQALISKQDMARMNLICQHPPEYTSENVTLIRVEKAKVSQSVFASMLNVSVSAVQKWESPSSGKLAAPRPSYCSLSTRKGWWRLLPELGNLGSL